MSVQTVSLLRDRSRDDSGRVAMVELFFDLVFVFAVTQLSHHLLEHLNPAGVVQTLLMFLALWWLWIFTTWTTNWLDPERVPVRLMLFALMLGGLMLSSSIPQAFAERGLAFAAAFAAMQLFRTAFMLFAFARHGRPDQTRNYARILVWLLASTVLWVMGGLAEPAARLGWWMAAVALEYAGPIAYFRVPGLGRSRTGSWDVEGRHIAERCALFVIIALGESLLITGATFAETRWTAVTLAAFATALLGSIAMWWIYFDTGADRASRRIERSGDPGRLARLAYTYLHLPIAAGIIVTAVADELVLVHPLHAENAGIATILGGPALYLLGTASFKWATNERRLPPLSHLAGLLLLCALAPFAFAHLLSALALGAITTAILVLVATWETIALRGARPGRAES